MVDKLETHLNTISCDSDDNDDKKLRNVITDIEHHPPSGFG